MPTFNIGGVEVPYQRVADLLVGAFEGGSSYWLSPITERAEPPKLEFRYDEKEVYRLYDYPLNEGGYISFKMLRDMKTNRLDLTSIRVGLEIMKEKWQEHWKNFIEENDDAETADVFLQCCLLNDIVYG